MAQFEIIRPPQGPSLVVYDDDGATEILRMKIPADKAVDIVLPLLNESEVWNHPKVKEALAASATTIKD